MTGNFVLGEECQHGHHYPPLEGANATNVLNFYKEKNFSLSFHFDQLCSARWHKSL